MVVHAFVLNISHDSACISYCLWKIYFFFFSAVAVVGLERALYQISEDAGEVEVCAVVYSPNIECPIPFHFDVRLTTGDESSGKEKCTCRISTHL